MAKPFSLQTVLEVMQNRSNEATQRLARLLAAEGDAKRKLAMLQQYRDEYAARFQKAAQNGLAQPAWRNYQDFQQRIEEAIAQQLQAVRLQQTHTAAGQAEWQQQRARLKALDALSERHRAGEARIELRQEQKVQDELASRRSSDEKDL